jgi:hypothetical protein
MFSSAPLAHAAQRAARHLHPTWAWGRASTWDWDWDFMSGHPRFQIVQYAVLGQRHLRERCSGRQRLAATHPVKQRAKPANNQQRSQLVGITGGRRIRSVRHLRSDTRHQPLSVVQLIAVLLVNTYSLSPPPPPSHDGSGCV